MTSSATDLEQFQLSVNGRSVDALSGEKDVHRAHRVAAERRAGTVWTNAYRVVAPDMPVGGPGHSGLGREHGIEAIDEYTETKSGFVELTGGTRDPFQ